MNVLLILLIIVAVIALVAWLSHRSIGDWEVRHHATQLQAKAHMDTGSSFGEGAAAALQGQDFWQNPHCTPIGSKDKGLAWNAGWCQGRQELDKIWRAEP